MTFARPRPKPGIMNITPYVPGKSGASGAKVFKLSSNESPLGASPKAVTAYTNAASTLHLYPDGSSAALRQAIASVHGLVADNVVCGAGSDELLQLLSHAYLSAGDEAIHSIHGFLVYPIAINANGATPVAAPETGFKADVDAILDLVTLRTRMIFIANPNNPTGTYLPRTEVERLHRALPANALLVLDEAYAEYVREKDYRSGLDLVALHENVVVARTFSKIYGLASLRLGWVYCPAHVADILNRIRGPFNVNAPSIAAGVAAVLDHDFVAAAAAHNSQWLDWTRRELQSLGLEVTPSAGNFLLIHFPGHGVASEADAFLISRGFYLRRLEPYGLPQALRMTVGTEDANRGVIAALREFLA